MGKRSKRRLLNEIEALRRRITNTDLDPSLPALAGDGTGNVILDSTGDIILSPTGGDILPDTDNVRNFGSTTKRWANIYTGDLHLKNDRGDWTIVEEKDCLCVINNITGKKYKMVLQEYEEE